ncbi:MAG: hypothetical protein II804_06525 [Clostridia bacterium]|nr:hypothetical protein [Clostridia bacterium]
MKKQPYQIAISVALVFVVAVSVILLALHGIHIDINYNYNGQIPAAQAAVQPQAAQPAAAEPAAAAQTPQAQEPAAAPAEAPAAPAAEPTTAAPAQQNTTASADQTPTQAAPEAPAAQPSAPQKGLMSKSQIVKLYNAAAAKVKPTATQLTRNYHHVSVPEDRLELPGAIQGIGKAAIGTFVKGSDEPESWTDKADIKTVFPIGGTDLSSRLTEDMVESASCTESGGSYKLQIKLYDDKTVSPQKGQGYAGVFNTIDAGTITGVNIPAVTFNKVDVQGVDGAIACTIDKKTSRITEITFSNTDLLSIDVKVAFSNLTAKLALVAEDNFTVAY